jgi:hypothetical protein
MCNLKALQTMAVILEQQVLTGSSIPTPKWDCSFGFPGGWAEHRPLPHSDLQRGPMPSKIDMCS